MNLKELKIMSDRKDLIECLKMLNLINTQQKIDHGTIRKSSLSREVSLALVFLFEIANDGKMGNRSFVKCCKLMKEELMSVGKIFIDNAESYPEKTVSLNDIFSFIFNSILLEKERLKEYFYRGSILGKMFRSIYYGKEIRQKDINQLTECFTIGSPRERIKDTVQMYLSVSQ